MVMIILMIIIISLFIHHINLFLNELCFDRWYSPSSRNPLLVWNTKVHHRVRKSLPSPIPFTMFRNMLAFFFFFQWRLVSLSPTSVWRTSPCWLSATAYFHSNLHNSRLTPPFSFVLLNAIKLQLRRKLTRFKHKRNTSLHGK